jgi:hypothetical protein
VAASTHRTGFARSTRSFGRQQAVLFAIPILAAGWLWHPLVQNYFIEDDFIDLFRICNLPLGKYLLIPQGGHTYVLRNLVYYTAARLFGTNTNGYFTIVWCAQLLNVGLLFWTVERFTNSAWLACFAAFLFGTCPVLEGSVGWFAVFGHVLAGTALLLVLLDAGCVTARGEPLSRARQWLWGSITVASVTLFGVSIGIAMALPFALAVLLPAEVRRNTRLPLAPLIVIVPIVYAGAIWLYSRLVQPGSLDRVDELTAYAVRRPGEIQGFFLGLVVYGMDRLLAGPLPLPPYPAVAGIAVAGAAILLGLWSLRYGPPPARRLLVASALLLGACYATIAAGRVALLAMMSLPVAVAQSRYHYVSIAILALGVAAVGMTLATAIPSLAQRRAPLLAACLAGWLCLVWVRPLAIDHHDNARTQVKFLVAWMRALAHQEPEGESVYITTRAFPGVSPVFISRREFPGWAGLFSIYFPDPYIDGRRAVFIEPDPAARAAAGNWRRLTGALVAPEDVPLLPDPMTPADLVCPLPAFQNALEQSP